MVRAECTKSAPDKHDRRPEAGLRRTVSEKVFSLIHREPIQCCSRCDNTGVRKTTLDCQVKKLNATHVLTSSIEALQWFITDMQANSPGSLLSNVTSVFLLFTSPLL